MESLTLAILIGQTKTTFNGIEFTLPVCKEREQKNENNLQSLNHKNYLKH